MSPKPNPHTHFGRNRVALAIIAIVALLLVLTFRIAVREPALTFEEVLHVFGWISQAEVAVSIEMGDFINLIKREFESKNLPPPATLAEVVTPKVLRANHCTRSLRYIRSGIDPWGNRFRYEVEKRGPSVFQVSIRSIGPNCLDEYGQGDDRQRTTSIIIWPTEEPVGHRPPYYLPQLEE